MHKHLTLPQTLTWGFFGIIFIGTLLLLLPFSTRSGAHTSVMTALFTATSATCITGLTLVNTATHWSWFGQVVLLLLIEVGALGFMSFTVLLYTLTNRKMTLSTRLLVKDSLNLANLADTRTVMTYVISLSLALQAGGALLLLPAFITQFGWLKGSYYSLCQAISAFGNAGFVFFPGSFALFAHNSYVLIVTSFLVIAGGLGFLVWRDLILYRQTHLISLHTKIAMGTSALLTLLAFVTFMITEWNLSVFKDQGWLTRLIDTFFLAITPRTAGFAIAPYAKLSLAGIAFTMLLMFIGGTPGSTAGGIKTTTLGVLALQTWAALRGKSDVTFSGRRFSQENISRALMLTFVATVFLVAATLLLSLTETVPKQFGIEYITFEVFAAFSTAGLSLGLTPHLTLFGQGLIMAIMFIGRVGVFTVMFSVLNVQNKPTAYRYPVETILIG